MNDFIDTFRNTNALVSKALSKVPKEASLTDINEVQSKVDFLNVLLSDEKSDEAKKQFYEQSRKMVEEAKLNNLIT
jgi:DsbC/DsbD-like thiol-disulfide interchange protein